MTKRERIETAKTWHEKGMNCTQSILLACRDLTGLSDEQSVAIASGFGGGMRCGSICGGISGVMMVLGMQYPAVDAASRQFHHKIVKEFQHRFQEQFGYLNCRELLAEKELHGTPIAEEVCCGNHCRLMICTAVEILSDYLDELKKE